MLVIFHFFLGDSGAVIWVGRMAWWNFLSTGRKAPRNTSSSEQFQMVFENFHCAILSTLTDFPITKANQINEKQNLEVVFQGIIKSLYTQKKIKACPFPDKCHQFNFNWKLCCARRRRIGLLMTQYVTQPKLYSKGNPQDLMWGKTEKSQLACEACLLQKYCWLVLVLLVLKINILIYSVQSTYQHKSCMKSAPWEARRRHEEV